MKRFLSLFLALVMSLALAAPAFAASAVEEPQMVDIELTITDDYGIIVSVPEDKAEEYRQICSGEISAACYLIIQSTVEYPKAWRVFERVP